MSEDDTLTLEAFLARAGELRRRKPTRIRNALRRLVLPDSGAPCWHCGQPAKHVEALIPERAGGTIRLENLAAACGWCRRIRGDLDPLEFAEAAGRQLSSTQHTQRIQALLVSLDDHPPSGKVTPFATRKIPGQGERWAHARIPLAVCVGPTEVWIAVTQAKAKGGAGALLFSLKRLGCELWMSEVIKLPAAHWPAVRAHLMDQNCYIEDVGCLLASQPELLANISTAKKALSKIWPPTNSRAQSTQHATA